MDFDTTQGVGEGVGEGAQTPPSVSPSGTEQAPPVSPNEPSATTEADLNTGADGSPTSDGTQTEIEGEGQETSPQPVALTEQEIASLEPKAAQAFARFRTENKGLSEEVTNLKQQLAEFQSQPKSTAPSIAVDAPVDEWKGLEQFNSLPAPYKEKLGDEIGWQRLPDLVSRAAANIEQLPPEWQSAIADPILESIGREFGLATPGDVIRAIQAGIGQTGSGDLSTSPSSLSQGSQSQTGLARQLVDAGYDNTDPLVIAAARQEQAFTQSQRQMQALEKRLAQFEQSNQAQTKEQAERTHRELETSFQAKLKATHETILTPTLQRIPKGYERYRRTVEVEAKESLSNDSVAQTHLSNARAALLQAQKYRQQGTPELAAQAEDKHNRELTAYAARFAVVTQNVLKDINTLITENISLKNGANQQQQQRKDLLGGGAVNGNGNGFQPRQPGEDMDAYLARAREYRMQETAAMDAQR